MTKKETEKRTIHRKPSQRIKFDGTVGLGEFKLINSLTVETLEEIEDKRRKENGNI